MRTATGSRAPQLDDTHPTPGIGHAGGLRIEKKHGERSAPYIGQRPDENTDQIEQQLDPEAERVAVTDNESSGEGAADRRVQGRDDEWPRGHRGGDRVSDDEARGAGEFG